MAEADILIRGRRFSIACAPGQEARIPKLGTQLDARLSAIAPAARDIGEARLLLIAAPALLDELDAAKRLEARRTDADRAEAVMLTMAERIEALTCRLQRQE
jgi:cell division protein ZapA